MAIFYLIIVLVICQRLLELVFAHRNEQWMKQHGGVEFGKKHYKWFVVIHCLFFIALIVEVERIVSEKSLQLNQFLLIVFMLAQVGRIWCIRSLGRFWNTKVIVLPKVVRIKKGPYKYVKHPNYIIVFIELCTLPLMFGAYRTAIIFSFLHLLLLFIRIPVETRALRGELEKNV